MENQREKLTNKVVDSICDCIDFLNLLTDQQDLNQNISSYLGPLRILKRELNRDLSDMQKIMEL